MSHAASHGLVVPVDVVVALGIAVRRARRRLAILAGWVARGALGGGA